MRSGNAGNEIQIECKQSERELADRGNPTASVRETPEKHPEEFSEGELVMDINEKNGCDGKDEDVPKNDTGKKTRQYLPHSPN